MAQTTLKVEGMSCSHCTEAVEGALKSIGAEATADLDTNSVSIQYDEAKLSEDALKEAIEGQGFDVVS